MSRKFKGQKKNFSDVHKFNATRKPLQKQVSTKPSGTEGKPLSKHCFRCGSPKHMSKDCVHASATCFGCGKKGHIQRICQADERANESNRRKNLKVLSRASDAALNGVTCPEQTPINVRVIVNETPLEMELDTGAAVSVISAKQQQRLFPSLQLTATALRLRTYCQYTGALVEPKGVVGVTVQQNGQIHVLPLYVIEQGGPPLLGRQWLQHLRLDWNTIFTCNKLSSALGTTDKGAKA
ncbi:uncharacterized protein LOC121835469 [Ixodes scapularis]|uniref:uncharacterized protein LOC121835469 n=1 Tax=Ixodes scapularis TaxID=6945 RepID=UPI001C38890A|nr:uncharacterized protein LOC121835469 [Ixodes scapularis]